MMHQDQEASISEQPIKPHEAEAIIFDIDGTLANSWKLGYDATQVVLKNNNIPIITEELYHECTKYSTPERLARHAGLTPSSSSCKNDDEEFQRVGKKLADEFDELYVGLVNLDTAGFYPGIQDLIECIPSETKKVGALTNACVAYAHAVLQTNCPIERNRQQSEENGNGNDNNDNDGENSDERSSSRSIYTKFSSIHGADTVPKPKPHPDGLYQCCAELDNIHPSKCVYVGDSPSDAVAAKACHKNMITIGVLWGSHPLSSLENAPFDYLCKDVKELKELLLG